jgi:hypothetical protein
LKAEVRTWVRLIFVRTVVIIGAVVALVRSVAHG